MLMEGFIALARRKLDDLVGASTSSLWSDDDFADYLFEVSSEVAQSTLCLRDSSAVEVCQIDVEAGTSYYALHDAILELQRVEYATVTTRSELKLATEDYLSRQCINWKTTAGVPTLYTFENEGIRLDRVPEEDSTLHLSVIRLVIDRIDAGSSGVCSEIPVRYHGQLINGVLARAFMKPDTEAFNKFKGEAYLKMQERDTEQIKRTELRRRKAM